MVTFKKPNSNFLLMPKGKGRDFPGGAVVKTPHSQCRGPGFDLRQGTRAHMHATTKSSHAVT